MSVESQAIIAAHVSIEHIVAEIKHATNSKHVIVHAMRKSDHKVCEFIGLDGSENSADVFLNSYAAEDYADVFGGKSTFLSMPFGPKSAELLTAIVGSVGGYVRPNSGLPWQKVTPAAVTL